MDQEIKINGKENKEEYDKGMDNVLEILKKREKSFLLIGAIQHDSNKVHSFIINSCSIGDLYKFLFYIKKAEKKLLKAIEKQVENDNN